MTNSTDPKDRPQTRYFTSAAPFAEQITRLADAAEKADGVAPFNEATLLELDGRALHAIANTENDDLASGDVLVAAALSRRLEDGSIEAEVAVHPLARQQGLGRTIFDALLASADSPVTIWAHGNLPGASRIATYGGMRLVRTLYKLGMPFPEGTELPPAPELPKQVGDAFITTFDEAADAREFIDLNARVFATHPEQGSLTLEQLRDRIAQPWFRADSFLVLREGTPETPGAMIGYNWVKLDEHEGEIYVIGVDAGAAGRGYGRSLMLVGLDLIQRGGYPEATLYVEGDNEPALALYRSLGFVDRAIDVQYRSTNA